MSDNNSPKTEMTVNPPTVILCIAGFDPSSGAGITADVLTAAAHGCWALTVPTALTVQSTTGVSAVEPVPPELVRRMLLELTADFDHSATPIRAIRVGMLGNSEVASVVADFLVGFAGPHGVPVVLDPVLRSSLSPVGSGGRALLDDAGLHILRSRLIPICTVVTPNTDEARVLTGIEVQDHRSQKAAASALLEMGARAVVLKGGHLDLASDLLLLRSEDGAAMERRFEAPKIASKNTHGTGCAFATSLACELAKGTRLEDAVVVAKQFVRRGIEDAPGIGSGIGPLKLNR